MNSALSLSSSKASKLNLMKFSSMRKSIDGDPIDGRIDMQMARNGNHYLHSDVSALHKDKGPALQTFWRGQHVILVNDPKLVKQIFFDEAEDKIPQNVRFAWVSICLIDYTTFTSFPLSPSKMPLDTTLHQAGLGLPWMVLRRFQSASNTARQTRPSPMRRRKLDLKDIVWTHPRPRSAPGSSGA